ncbi:hypothetical protein [Billgrantia saliphila]|uniref:hypothetical protein n=1 Tax=Billgrantia saliphila TaxID=1848458 RepID=UPI0018CC302A|nr:hypothetical protein [Halomonas saliphila]
MGRDQAAGLRQWASATSQECPTHVAEMLIKLAGERDTGERSPRESREVAKSVPPRPATTRDMGKPPSSRRTHQGVTLMVLGLPGTAERHTLKVSELLQSWARQGRRWVGDPGGWRVVALSVTSPHLAVLATQQAHWALWVDDDLEAFRRAYRILKQIDESGGPRRLLAVHPPGVGRQGLLANLQHVAASYFGIELLVLSK